LLVRTYREYELEQVRTLLLGSSDRRIEQFERREILLGAAGCWFIGSSLLAHGRRGLLLFERCLGREFGTLLRQGLDSRNGLVDRIAEDAPGVVAERREWVLVRI